MSERAVFDALLVTVFVLAVATFFGASRVIAPYGRHGRKGWGPGVPVRIAWLVMESPAVLVIAGCYALGSRSGELVPIALLAMWLSHYGYRAFIYPLRLRASSDRTMPLAVMAMAIVFNVMNGYLNGRSLTEFGPVHDVSWLWSFPFLFGVALFFAGIAINRWSDRVLVSLRAPGDNSYKIPRGGLYELVSCPNYLGEMLQWLGFALAAWSPAALSFALFTIANLFPRALSHHAWYRATFPDYPKHRRAVIPFLL
jgi:protein-S-isoprenylcysteine O-methyltransferase Ste14